MKGIERVLGKSRAGLMSFRRKVLLSGLGLVLVIILLMALFGMIPWQL